MNEREQQYFYDSLPQNSLAKSACNQNRLLDIVNYLENGKSFPFVVLAENINTGELIFVPCRSHDESILREPVLRKMLANPEVTAYYNLSYAKTRGVLDDSLINGRFKILEYYNLKTKEYVVL